MRPGKAAIILVCAVAAWVGMPTASGDLAVYFNDSLPNKAGTGVFSIVDNGSLEFGDAILNTGTK